MFKTLARCALLSFALSSAVLAAEPIKLKMAYFSSDRTTTYLAAIKPFVDAVNAEPGSRTDRCQCERHTRQKPNTAAAVGARRHCRPGICRPRLYARAISGQRIIELPGLFKNIREATLVYTGLIAANALRGYDDLFVVGAFSAEPETIHTQLPVASLKDLSGMRIRSNNPVQARFDGLALFCSASYQPASGAISSGKLDGAMVGPAPLIELASPVCLEPLSTRCLCGTFACRDEPKKVRGTSRTGRADHTKIQR